MSDNGGFSRRDFLELVGVGLVLVEVIGARYIFNEAISLPQWLGVGFVTVGIALIASGAQSH